MVVMMYDFCSHVNVFQGNGEIDLPTPQGSAKTWYFIKAICGNTHPGAQLPFGKYSCCLHSTGYPTGYGKHSVNCGGPINYLFDEMPFVGLSHFHQSGTGTIGVYYNYALTSPGSGGTPDFSMRKVLDEQARPGYYSCNGRNFYNTVVEKTAESSHMNVVVDQVGCPTYAPDLAQALFHIIEKGTEGKEGIYHYTGQGVCSWYDFAVAIRDAVGHICRIDPCRSSDYPAKAKRPVYSVLDCSRIKKVFGLDIPHWTESVRMCTMDYERMAL